jgi:hypothetical protein
MGKGLYDTSAIESFETKLAKISYRKKWNKLPSPLPINYQNTVAWSQTINESWKSIKSTFLKPVLN